jgi:hypothetical protein
MAQIPPFVYLQPVAVLATNEPEADLDLDVAASRNYIKRLDASIPLAAAEMVPMNQVLMKTFSSTPVIWDTQLVKEYQGLGEALTQMTELDEESKWGIERPVYEAACFVAAGLMINSFPAPRVFNHGPKSVVFNWTDTNSNNLYLTVSADRISALVSSPERIKRRLEFPTERLLDYGNLLGSIRSAQLERPVLMPASGISDPTDFVG